MFKTLAFTAVVASVQALDALDTLTDTYTCTTTLADKSTFQLKDLKSTTGYSKNMEEVSDTFGDNLTWNYCQAFQESDDKTVAGVTTTEEFDWYAMLDYGYMDIYFATEAIKTDGSSYKALFKEDGTTVNGVSIEQMGSADCPTVAGTKLSFTTDLTCDKTITTVDPLVVVASVDADKCHYKVAFAHAAGCPVAKDITDITDKL